MPYKDPEQAKAAKRRYYERNMAACKARAAAHKAQDPEREKARLRQWHADNNLQLLPKLNNRSKGNRHWPDMP